MILQRKSENCNTSTPLVGRRKPFYIPKRYVFCFFAFIGFFMSFAMRVIVSITMVAMVNKNINTLKNNTFHQECPALISENDWAQEREYKGKRYDWDAKTQGLILSSFCYGYTITQLLGGYLAEQFSAKWLFTSSVAGPSILSLFTPFAADFGVPVFIATQVLQGLLQSALYPAATVLISRWSPPVERSRITTFVFTGCQVGTVVAMPVSGWLCSSELFGGWPATYYLFGVFGIIWFFACSACIYESPEDHPSISGEEKCLLLINVKEKSSSSQNKVSTPWKQIFTSCPVWAFVIATMADELGFLMFLTELPNYLHSILHYSIKADGALSALPFVAQVISAWLVSYFADRLTESDRLSITNIRKIMTLIGLIIPAVCLMCVTAAGCQHYVIVSLLILAMAFNGFLFSGVHVLTIDMCPEFSGTVFGLGNGLAYVFAASFPVIVGFLTESGDTIQNWSKAFYLTSAVYVLAAVFFTIFGSAEEQVWINQEKSSTSPPTVNAETEVPRK